MLENYLISNDEAQALANTDAVTESWGLIAKIITPGKEDNYNIATTATLHSGSTALRGLLDLLIPNKILERVSFDRLTSRLLNAMD